MDSKQGRFDLTLNDFKKYSIWKFNDIDELNYPVTCEDDFPDNIFDLRIRANFILKSGRKLQGLIVGIKNIFAIGVFVGDEVFRFNKNFNRDHLEKRIKELEQALGQKLDIKDFSPMKYKTDIDLEGFRNIEGEFDLLKKRTDKERLGSYYVEK